MAMTRNTNVTRRDAFLIRLTALERDPHRHAHAADATANQAIVDSRFLVRGRYAFASAPIARDTWAAHFPRFIRNWGSHGDPLQDRIEYATLVYFMSRIEPVLETPLQPCLTVSMRFPFRMNEPQMHVTGESGYVIMRGDVPCCVVEPRHFEVDDALFHEGVAQAVVYAAAIGRETDQPHMLAIATDLCRWQSLRAGASGCRRSVVEEVEHEKSSTGHSTQTRPVEASLRAMLKRVLGFLVNEWP